MNENFANQMRNTNFVSIIENTNVALKINPIFIEVKVKHKKITAKNDKNQIYVKIVGI